MPMEEDELREQYKREKEEAVAKFTKKAVGSMAEQYVKELKGKMKALFGELKDENERESTHAC